MPYTYDTGVRLGFYLDKSPGTGVALFCLNVPCGFVQKFSMEDVVRRLEARGVDAREVGIKALPEFLRRPCPACGGSAFEARPDFAPAPMGLNGSARVPVIGKMVGNWRVEMMERRK